MVKHCETLANHHKLLESLKPHLPSKPQLRTAARRPILAACEEANLKGYSTSLLFSRANVSQANYLGCLVFLYLPVPFGPPSLLLRGWVHHQRIEEEQLTHLRPTVLEIRAGPVVSTGPVDPTSPTDPNGYNEPYQKPSTGCLMLDA